LTETDKTEHNHNQQHKNQNSYTRKRLKYTQTKANKTETTFRGLLYHPARNGSDPVYNSEGPRNWHKALNY